MSTSTPRRGLQPRVVLLTRKTELEELRQRHATIQQAAFFLRSRRQRIDPVRASHSRFEEARRRVIAAIPEDWRRTAVDRADLDRFLFEPDDVVVALGQDGLVANVAKYLDGQPVIGINPDPDRYEGVLVPHSPDHATELIRGVVEDGRQLALRTMIAARLDNGRELVALNEIFVGHRSHQSARYDLRLGDQRERHSSSGLIVASGTGATGWARSIATERHYTAPMPKPDELRLVFFVREAWPSIHTGTDYTAGQLDEGQVLSITSRMDGGVVFGDGIESDRIELDWGRTVELGLATRRLRLA